MHRSLILWIVAGVVVLGALLVGTITLAPRPRDPDAFCSRYPYGTDYETCRECIGSEAHCESAWGDGRQPYQVSTPTPSPIPTPTGDPALGGYRDIADVCAHESYGVDYRTCVECIHSEPYCNQIWNTPRGGSRETTITPAPSAAPKASPTTTPKAKPTASPAPVPSPTPTPSPSPTPQYDCNLPYGDTYEECVYCLTSQSYCQSVCHGPGGICDN